MKPDELKTAYQQLQALCTQAADALQEHIDQFTESHTNPETGLIDEDADLMTVVSDSDLVSRLRAAALPVMRVQPEPTQCWKCGDMDAVGHAKCDAPACGMKEQPEPVAWMHVDAYQPNNRHLEWSENCKGYEGDWIKHPLYTTPPAQPAAWVDFDEVAAFCRVAFGRGAGDFNAGIDAMLAELKRREKSAPQPLRALCWIDKTPFKKLEEGQHVLTTLTKHRAFPGDVALCAAQPASLAACTWSQVDDQHAPGTWQADCGAIWTFTEGGPAGNDMKFCPKCGKHVAQKGGA